MLVRAWLVPRLVCRATYRDRILNVILANRMTELEPSISRITKPVRRRNNKLARLVAKESGIFWMAKYVTRQRFQGYRQADDPHEYGAHEAGTLLLTHGNRR